MKSINLFFCILLFVPVLWSAGPSGLDDAPSLGLPPPEVLSKPDAPVNMNPPAEPKRNMEVENFHYDPVGKRDPFRPFRDSKIGVGQLGLVKTRTPEPLENFDVKTLEVVAILWGIAKPKALIQDPNKIIHTVVKGMRIGKNDGVIAEIREGEVVVVELFDLNGRVVKESVVLPIKK